MDDEQSQAAKADREPSGDTQQPRRTDAINAVLTSAGVGSMAGMVAGFVWGGIGGRIAMRVLFLTSSDSVGGLTSDDGFEIGRISGDTIFLLIFTAMLGAMAGLLYGLLRMLLRGPRWSIAIAVGVTAAAGAGGGLIVNAHGIDFRVLDPLWLAVGLFLLIPGAWGVTVVLLTERLLQPGAVFKTLPSQIDKRYWGIAGSGVGWFILPPLNARSSELRTDRGT
jgi:hypothetical protein